MGPMIVEEYQPSWADEFRAVRDVLSRHLGPLAREIHHVGSTSIPGMPAKPCIDIDIEIPSDVPLDTLTTKLGELGYRYEGERGIPDRHAYRMTSEHVPLVNPPRDWVTQHVYVCPTGSAELRRHLHFRDALVASPELREQYARIKRQCLGRATDGQPMTYQAAKDELGDALFRRVLSMVPIPQRINGAHDLLESAERDLEAGHIDEVGWHRRIAEVITPAYLAGDSPRRQSGHSGDESRWTRARGLIADAIDRDGTFLDVGCASGYLMETLQRWCAEKGCHIEPYGLDIAPELADLARRRLPQWSDRIFVGNALDWRPPRRFDIVRTGLEYVPRRRQSDLVAHLLKNVVSPGGRLIIGTYNEARASLTIPTTKQLVTSWGHRVAGQSERPHDDCRICYRVIWIDRDAELESE